MALLKSVTGLIDNFSDGNLHLSNLTQSWVYVFAAAVILCFLVGELTRNYSQTDKLWSIMPVIYGWMSVSYYPDSARLWLMAVIVTVWGFRLSHNFFRKGGYSIIPWKGGEDYRWIVMRNNPFLRGGLRFGLFNLFFISFYQHFLILLFSSPLLLAAKHSSSKLSIADIIAACSMLFFIVVETVADNQQFRFQQLKKSPANADFAFSGSVGAGFLTEGLWRYMRHPNFMAEQAIWISFYFFGVAASGNWINWTLAGPLLLVLLFQGSTFLTESISSSKYPAYADYKKKVPKFLPRSLFGRSAKDLKI